jgi:amino acid adenylation domain-containing protein
MEMDVEYTESILKSPFTSQEHFWKQFLKGFNASTFLFGDSIKSKDYLSVFDYQEVSTCLNESSTSIFNRFIQEQNLEVSSVLQGGWALLLHHYSGEDDIIFGFQTAQTSLIASDKESKSQLIPIRIKIEPDKLVVPWLLQVQEYWKITQTYSQVSLNQIQAWSDIPSDISMFETGIIFGNLEQAIALSDLPITIGIKIEPQLTLLIRYDRNRFQEAAINRLLGHLQTLIESLVTNPEQKLASLPMLTTAERHQILIEWNNTQVTYPSDQTIHQIFAEQVAKSPDKIALILPSLNAEDPIRLTYKELDRRANILACELQRLGVGSETFVAMCIERSIETIVAIIGILKAGGVYVPLDPAYPQERLAFMLEDTQAPVLITQSHLRDRLPPTQSHIICLETDWGKEITESIPEATKVNADSLAYINYTSGSTGRPKGVAIPHRAVSRLVFGTSFTELDGNQTLLQLAPISFDAATLEIWGALLHGGCCVLFPSDGIPDPQDLKTVIQTYGVTTMWLTAALFNTIIAESPESLLGVKELLTGGEALSPSFIRLAQKHLPETQLINGYGPTENTTFTCCYRIPRPLGDQVTSVPIGRPIANTQVYILDTHGEPVPIGVLGELHVGGAGLAREYINRPDLTAEKFIPDPFSADSPKRLYKTGDRVRWLPDGTIEFVERLDNQVKIRGFRIELGEIEAALSHHESVRDAVVIVREDIVGSKRLVAYITPKSEQSPNINLIKGISKNRCRQDKGFEELE